MAQRLNKKLVVGLTIAGMAVTTLGGVFMIYSMPQKDPKPMAEQAEKLAAEGKYEDAAKYYHQAYVRARATGENSEEAIAYLIKVGDMCLTAGKDRDAEGAWATVLQANPNHVEAQQKIVELNVDRAKLIGAGFWRFRVKPEAEKLCEITEFSNLVGLHALGRALSELGGVGDEKDREQAEKAEEYLRKAFDAAKTDPEFADSLANHYHRQAAQAIVTAYQTAQGMREAETAYQAMIEKANDVYETLVNALEQDDPKKSETLATAWRKWGQFHLVIRQTATPVVDAKRTRRPDPSGEARFEKIIADADDQALRCLTKAAELAPDEPEAPVMIGTYWATKRSQAPDEASRTAERAGFLAKAEERFKAAIVKDPDSFEGYLQLAGLYRQQNDYDKALDTLQERIKREIVRTGMRQWRNKADMSRVLATAFEINLAKIEEIRRKASSDTEYKTAAAPIIESLTKLHQSYAAEQPDGAKNPQAMFMEARLYVAEGNDVKAIATLRDTERQLGNEIVLQIKLLLAELYVRAQQPGAASRELRALVERPEFARIEQPWAMLALIQADMPNSEQDAINAANAALRINPNNLQALYALSTVYGKQKNLEGMAEIQRKIAELTGAQRSEIADKVLRASMLLTRAQDSETPNEALVTEAKNLLREVLAADPGHIQALQAMVQLLAQDKTAESFAETTALLDKAKTAIEQPPADPAVTVRTSEQREALLGLIERLRVVADPQTSDDEKVRQMEETIRHGEDPFTVAVQLYQLYTTQPDRREDAVKQLKEAYRLRPDNPGIVERLFNAALADEDWTLAESLIGKARELGLARSGGHYYRGLLLFARQDVPDHFAQAEREFREGLVRNPDHSDGHAKLAHVLLAMNRFDDAEKSATEALGLNPKNGLANFILAYVAGARGDDANKQKYLEICRKLGVRNEWIEQQQQAAADARDPAKGIARREEIRQKEPENIENLVALANLYSAAGQMDKVRELLAECNRLQPKNLVIAEQYASFLRRQTPPRYEDAEKIIRNTIEQFKDDAPENRALAQMLLAAHMENMARAQAPDAPTPEEIDAAFVAVAEIADSAKVLTDIASHFQRRNQPAKAEEWLRKAIASAVRDTQTASERQLRQQLIEFILQSRDSRRAPELLKEIEAYRSKFDDAFGLAALSDHASLTGREYRAMEYMNQYVAAQPNDAWGFFNRGNINARRSEWELAIKDYRSAKALDPQGLSFQHRLNLARCFIATGQNDQAVAELTSILNENNRMMAALQTLYDLYMRLGRHGQAEALVLPLQQSDPENPQWPTLLSEVARARQDAGQALQFATRAAQLGQYDPRLLDRVLGLYTEFRRYDDMIQYVSTLPEETRSHPNVLARLGSAYAAKGDKIKAVDLFMKSLDAVENNVQGFLLVSRNLAQSLNLTLDEATELVNKRLAEKPNEPASMLVRAILLKEKGDEEGFIRDLRELLTKLPADDPKVLPVRVEAMQRLAVALYERKDFAATRQLYKELIELNPENVPALNNLAYLLMEDLNDPKSALPYAEEAARLAPGQANVLDTLGWNLVLDGRDYDRAISYLRQAALSSVGLDVRSAAPIHYHAAFGLWKRSQAENSSQDLAEAKAECTEAHRLIMEAKADPDKILPKVVELGKQLGLDLTAELPAADVTAAAK